MLMFEIVDGKGIIDTHGLMIKSIVFLQRKTQKWYKQIFDRLF